MSDAGVVACYSAEFMPQQVILHNFNREKKKTESSGDPKADADACKAADEAKKADSDAKVSFVAKVCLASCVSSDYFFFCLKKKK